MSVSSLIHPALLLAFSAFLLGFVHSLIPSHWVPIVLISKAQRWPLQKALFGSAIASVGHLTVSLGLGLIAVELGFQLLHQHEEAIERFAGISLALFGVLYLAWAKLHQMRHCHDHHSDSDEDSPTGPKARRHPWGWLFLLGFSPCVAVLPILATASGFGVSSVGLASLGYALGVFSAFSGATGLALSGLGRLELPWLERNGELATGIGIIVTGILLSALHSITG